MTLAYVNSISPASAFPRGLAIDETNNVLVLVESTGASLRKYDLTALTQIGSNITITGGCAAVALVAGVCAVVPNSGSTGVDVVELSTGYKTTHSGGTTVTNSSLGQKCASDYTNKIVIMCPNGNTNYIWKFNASTQTFTVNSTFDIAKGSLAISVIYKSANRFLVGTNQGEIVEIDDTLTIVRRITTKIPYAELIGANSTGGPPRQILSMALDNNFLHVCFDANITQVYDYSTGTLLKTLPIAPSSNGFDLSNPYNGLAVRCLNTTSSPGLLIEEIDLSIRPGLLVSQPLQSTMTSQTLFSPRINTSTGRGAAIEQSGPTIRIFDVTARSSTNRTVNVNPGGVHQKFELIIWQDAGVGTADIIIDTVTQSPATVRVPTGKTLYELVIVGDGDNATGHLSTYNT